MKAIIVKWVPTDDNSIYDMEMRVISSNHPRFQTGTRFDYGFFNVASKEGYMIISYPLEVGNTAFDEDDMKKAFSAGFHGDGVGFKEFMEEIKQMKDL